MKDIRKTILSAIGLITATILLGVGMYRLMIAIIENPERTMGMWLTLAIIALAILLLWVIGVIRSNKEATNHRTESG